MSALPVSAQHAVARLQDRSVRLVCEEQVDSRIAIEPEPGAVAQTKRAR